MKEKHFYYFKHWFVFPLSITVHTALVEYCPPGKSIEIHFLWWHWRWLVKAKDGERHDGRRVV